MIRVFEYIRSVLQSASGFWLVLLLLMKESCVCIHEWYVRSVINAMLKTGRTASKWQNVRHWENKSAYIIMNNSEIILVVWSIMYEVWYQSIMKHNAYNMRQPIQFNWFRWWCLWNSHNFSFFIIFQYSFNVDSSWLWTGPPWMHPKTTIRCKIIVRFYISLRPKFDAGWKVKCPEDISMLLLLFNIDIHIFAYT